MCTGRVMPRFFPVSRPDPIPLLDVESAPAVPAAGTVCASAHHARCRRPMAAHGGVRRLEKQLALAGVARDGVCSFPRVVSWETGAAKLNAQRPSRVATQLGCLPCFKT